MAVYVVTGGGGFIGSHIVEELLRRNETVKIIDNFSTGKRENVEPFRTKAEVIETDISESPRTWQKSLKGADYVIHQAAIPSVPKSIIDPLKSHQANVNGTLQLLIAARDAGVKRVVYASSSSLYGDSPTLPKHEGMMPNPLSPYGAQKLFAEMYCQVFTKAYGLETVSLAVLQCVWTTAGCHIAIQRRAGSVSFPLSCRIGARRSTATGCSRAISRTSRMSSKRILLACKAPGVAGRGVQCRMR